MRLFASTLAIGTLALGLPLLTAHPADAAAIAFLASDDAAFITGAMLPMDGANSAV